MPLLQRAMMEQFHETHIETALMADVSPWVKLSRSMTHHALFGLLYKANADTERGREMITRLMDDVKMLHFDGIHTLKFVFHSRRLATAYSGIALRLQGTYLELEDSIGGGAGGILRPAQLRRQYAVRVYNMESIGLVALLATLGQLPGVTIVDAERPRIDSTEVVDNRYVVLRFQGQECSTALRGVTKIDMIGKLMTVQHHLIYPRAPCARCIAPYHMIGFCKAKINQVARVQNKHKRVYEGSLPKYQVGEAVQYRHSDGESLTGFLATLQGEIETGMGKAEGAWLVVLEDATNSTGQGGTTGGPTLATTDSVEASGLPNPPAGTPASSADDGFRVAQSKSAKARAAGQAKKPREPNDAAAYPPESHTPGTPVEAKRMSAQATAQTKGQQRNHTGKKKKLPNPPGYASFNGERALGRFAALEAMCVSEDDGSEDADDDDAPYAYGEDHMPRTQAPDPKGTVAGSVVVASPCAPQLDVTMDVDSDSSSSLSGYVGSSAPPQPESFASTPGSEFLYSIASTPEHSMETQAASPRQDVSNLVGGTSEENGFRKGDARSDGQGVEQPSLIQDGFIIERTKHRVGMPPVFLNLFGGSLIDVPSNGQCAYAAFYATTSYVVGGALHFMSEVVRGANAIKRSIYTIMMTNLAEDVECGVLVPRRELERLYPKQPTPTDQAAATATLYAHYAQERSRSVNTQIPSDFWAGAEVLRAMTQYLREPLFVFDLDANNDAHVQRYYYKEYVAEDGAIHETGCGGAMDDKEAKTLLTHSARLHVLPVMMVIKRHEGHFYGVHHGGISTGWLAEGDRQFAEANCNTHPWYEEVLAHMEYSEARLLGLHPMAESEEVNLILIGGMEHRARLDVVHERLGLHRLNGDGFDIAQLESTLGAEGERLQAAAGLVATQPEAEVTDGMTGGRTAPGRRFPLATHGRVALAQAQRILDSIGLEPEVLPDRNKLRQILQVNADAVTEWSRKAKAEARSGRFPDDRRGLLDLLPWLLAHRQELHSLFRFLPYPELAAKMLPTKTLQQWGALEVYDARVGMLRAVMHDPTSSAVAAEHCRASLAACTIRDGDQQDRTVAGEQHRWARLLQPKSRGCSRPEHLPMTYWHILHTLPFTVWAWKATPLGSVPRAQLGFHYSSQPAVQNLCELVDERANWGAAVVMASGLTWDDRLASMEAGVSAQPRY